LIGNATRIVSNRLTRKSSKLYKISWILTKIVLENFVALIFSRHVVAVLSGIGVCIMALFLLAAGQVCKQCRPQRQYIRLCDLTERTALRRHRTGRRCRRCRGALFDTIVHFGEKGGHQAPYNWQRAASAANSADVILCLGSSLKASTCCL